MSARRDPGGAAKKKSRFKIEPFKNKVELDPHYADRTWKILEDAIHEIHNHNAFGLSYEELYRNAYNMVLHKCGDKLYSGLENTITKHLTEITAHIEAAHGGPFLEELSKRWLDHNKTMHVIGDILMYMDRTYVKQQKKLTVHDLGLKIWRDNVVRSPSIQQRVLNTLLELVHAERTGEAINKGLLRSITQMLMDLGLPVYQEDFEKPFLQASADFYKVESQEFIATCNCSDYMRKAETRLEEETARVTSYLDASTEPKITLVVEAEMLGAQMKALVEMPNSGLVSMLEDNKFEDLHRMYTLFRRTGVKGGLALMRDVLSKHVRETGKALVEDPERWKDPVEYVERLLAERDRYEAIISRSFLNDRTFQHTLSQAFEYFINLNNRSPEFICLFIDDKLRKGIKNLNEDDIEMLLDKVMILFRYLQEKDIFEKYYKQLLGKRLLSGRSVSDDAERSLIVKLRTECGYQFTSKLEGMFTDIRTSKDTMQQFRDSGPDLGRLELTVQVLTTGSWPTQPAAQCTLPAELNHCCEAFRSFYTQKHTGRRLTWQTNMGTADLKASFGGGACKYELNVSTYQMCILLLFNDADALSYNEIHAATDIPEADLKRALQSLSCVKHKNVLRKEPVGKDVSDADTFHFNDNFRSKQIRVKINTVAAQKESEPEKQETRQKVEEDRKITIEAAIVRIMKSRRVLDHNNLIADVTSQLSALFMPTPHVIKTRIESLIEREYIERDKADRKKYHYLA